MIIVVGLVVLVAAVVVGVAGVLVNRGAGHALVHPFAVFSYHVTGSSGRLFLYGIVLGAIGVAGLGLLLAGARRTSRRGSDARRGLEESRQETAAVSADRDDLISQRETARAYMAGDPGGGAASSDPGPRPDGSGPDARGPCLVLWRVRPGEHRPRARNRPGALIHRACPVALPQPHTAYPRGGWFVRCCRGGRRGWPGGIRSGR